MTAYGGPSPRSLGFRVTAGKPTLTANPISEEGREDSVLVRAGLGQTGSATVSARATSPTGYAELDYVDFEAWSLVPPQESLSSEVGLSSRTS